MIKHTDQNDKRFFTGKECFWQTIGILHGVEEWFVQPW